MFQVIHKQIIKDLTDATGDVDRVNRLIEIFPDPYSAAVNSHAIIICTEWDEFIVSFRIVFHVFILFICFILN